LPDEDGVDIKKLKCRKRKMKKFNSGKSELKEEKLKPKIMILILMMHL